MDRDTKKTIGIALTLLAITSVGFYAYRQSRDYILGSRVIINEPHNGSLITDESIIVNGNAQNIAYISLNDSPIFVDSKGDFREKILLLDGYNIISVKAQDRFGKKTEKSVEVIYHAKEIADKNATSTSNSLN